MPDPQEPAESRNGAAEPVWAPGRAPDPEESGANTEMFRAFVAGADEQPGPAGPGAVGAPFRLLTLAGALLVFLVVVWLLLR